MDAENSQTDAVVETVEEAPEESVGQAVTAEEQSVEFEAIEDPRIVAAVERLADLEGLPVAEQVEIFADIHARLTEALGTETGGDPSTASV